MELVPRLRQKRAKMDKHDSGQAAAHIKELSFLPTFWNFCFLSCSLPDSPYGDVIVPGLAFLCHSPLERLAEGAVETGDEGAHSRASSVATQQGAGGAYPAHTTRLHVRVHGTHALMALTFTSLGTSWKVPWDKVAMCSRW